MPRPLFVSVLGWSATGKTTLIAKALRECVRRGIKVAAAKRSRQAPDIASPGKDSSIFLEAGASASLYVGGKNAARFEASPEKDERAWYEERLPGADIVFLEGAVVEGALVVLLSGDAREKRDLKRSPADCDLFITSKPALADGAPVMILAPEAINEFVDFLEERHGK